MGIFISHWPLGSIIPLFKKLCKPQVMTAGRHISQAGGCQERIWGVCVVTFFSLIPGLLIHLLGKNWPQMFPGFILPRQHHQRPHLKKLPNAQILLKCPHAGICLFSLWGLISPPSNKIFRIIFSIYTLIKLTHSKPSTECLSAWARQAKGTAYSLWNWHTEQGHYKQHNARHWFVSHIPSLCLTKVEESSSMTKKGNTMIQLP